MPRIPHVRRLAGTFLCLAMALAALGVLAASQEWAPTFVSALGRDEARPPHGAPQSARDRERNMYVSVTDRQGKPVTGLPARDFVVREDGMAREVLMAEPADDPITIALLVDNSSASTPVVADVRRALTAFVKKMGEGENQNPIAVMTFGDRPTVQQDYTLVVDQVLNGVQRIFPQPGSGAVILQAIVEASKGLATRDFERAVIVAITTEGPDFSELNDDQVLPVLRQSGATLDAFVFNEQVSPDPRSDGVRQRMLVLDKGPRATGGRRQDLITSMALDDALAKLADQLTHEYKITYSRPESLIPPEKIEVSVTRAGLEARGIPVRQKSRG